MNSSTLLSLHHSYASLPERFYTRTLPTLVRAPQMVKCNHALADTLGLDGRALDSPEGAALLSGSHIPEGAQPVAMAYAGHQFGYFVPQLGDGRAILLGEVMDASGSLWDIHLKGAGQTPFSRRGDGRAALGPVVREYIISEAMHALGIPTTRSLAIVSTGEPVFRETALPGAVLARVAASHIRIGTFEYFATRGDTEAIALLTDYTLERHYPHLLDRGNRYVALLEAVADAQARLVAGWLHVGFVHGVMNTDNMTISGETIDYGPCAFMEAYDPATVFSSIDHHGRYAYGNQPHIAQWNLARFAEALMVAAPQDNAQKEAMQEIVDGFHVIFMQHWLEGMRHKLGLVTQQDADISLVTGLLELMQRHGDDYTNTLRALGGVPLGKQLPAHYAQWCAVWSQRLQQEGRVPEFITADMNSHNPAFIPRNHRVEEAIEAAVQRNDLTPMETLLQVLKHPFDDQPEHAVYSNPGAPSEGGYRTYCGT